MKIPHVKNAGKMRYVKMPTYGLGALRAKLSRRKRRISTRLIRMIRPPK
jgi:hypothetical protein